MEGCGDAPMEASQRGENIIPGVHVAKAARKDKGSRHLVESIHLSTLCAAYNQHFAIYSQDKKQVSQLIPSAVWKAVYVKFKEEYPESTFQEDTLKERLRETLRELKTGTSNEEGSEKVQNDVLTRLKSAEAHVARNILKRQQSLVDGMASPSIPSTPTPPALPHVDLEAPSSTPSSASGPASASNASERARTEVEMLQLQSRSIERMAATMEADSLKRHTMLQQRSHVMEQRSALMEARLKISLGKANAIKINNLRAARDLGVISEVEFKAKVKEVLDL